MGTLRSARVTLEMIKWEHSVFALPFALTGMVLAAGGWPSARITGLIVVCMVAARSAAMAFNRLVDSNFDAQNPRTATRALPAGLLQPRFVRIFIALCCGIFLLAAWLLNPLALALAPLALAIVLGYSYAKRYTRWTHLFLGLALGIAPAAGWIAVRGTMAPGILVLSLAVLCWVAGFDVLYACQDRDFDLRAGLHSVPRAYGIKNAIRIARALHVLALALLAALVKIFGLGKISVVGVGVVGVLLVYEHSLVSERDLRRLNTAFFTMNGIIAVVFFLCVAADVALRSPQ